MANISYTSICVSSSFLGFKEGTSLGLSGLSAPEEDSRTRQCRDQIPPNGNAATADVTGLLTNQDQSVQGLQRVNYTSPASPENLRSLGQKLCLWHPKDFCLGRTSLARGLPPMTRCRPDLRSNGGSGSGVAGRKRRRGFLSLPPASPENLRSLGKKLCLWHRKHFCLGRTSLARDLPPIAGF